MSPPKVIVRFSLKCDGRKQRFITSMVLTCNLTLVYTICSGCIKEHHVNYCGTFAQVLQGYLRSMKNFKLRPLGFSNQCTNGIQTHFMEVL